MSANAPPVNSMKLLVTNDDGVDAPGLQALLQALGEDVMVVAPDQELSGCSHQVTTRQPLQLQQRAEQVFALSGTPVDCVRVALRHLDPALNYVLSGINQGANLGTDIYISGTVAAIREAALHGLPGIAFSQYRRGKHPIDWARATRWTRRVMADLIQLPLPPGNFWNVNFPHLEPEQPDPAVIFCPPCTRPLSVNFRVEGAQLYYVGEYAQRSRTPGADVDVCFSGAIAVSEIHL
ncbi:5'/3'-nucleotidase SurE [Neosynechococcus sphagnicola]|nr:5'/3'-nucleotidase SurE [Neosynechococcus sphagnicola]